MTDPTTGQPAPSNPAPAYAPPPQNPFPPMPKNPAAAAGMASGFFGATNPSMLVVYAIALYVVGSLIVFIESFFEVAFLSPLLRWIAGVIDSLGLVCLVVGAARFVADAFKSRA